MSGLPSLFTLISWILQATAKGSVAIVLVAVAQRLIGRRVQARWRHALWLLIALRLIAPVAPSSTWSIFNLVPAHPGIQLQLRGPAGQIVFQPRATASVAGWLPLIQVPWWIAGWKWVAAIWICGALAFAARALVATARIHWVVRRALRGDAPGSSSNWTVHQIVEGGRRQLGITRLVRVVESALIDVPALHGVIRPTLLLPEGFAESFESDELRHVILHELCHLRRHDIAVNWLLTAVQAVHWFNPVVWFAVSRIEEERELACDELTLSCLQQNERFGYGRTILKLLDRFRSAESVPALVGIVNPKQRMRRRIMMIGTVRRGSRFSGPVLVMLTLVSLVALTDARGVEPPALGSLDPSGVETLEQFNGRVTFDLTDGSFSDLLEIIGRKSGVAVTQSPAIANSAIQQARFTLRAKRVPAGRVLTAVLLPFHLVSAPAPTGVRVTTAPSCFIRHSTTEPGECLRTADGALRREMSLDGGRLTIDVSGSMAK